MADVELGPSWDKKLLSFGKRMHVEGNGFFSKNDYKYIADRCLEMGKFDDVQEKELYSKMNQIWETFFASDATDDVVDAETFLEAVRKNKDLIRVAAQKFFDYWFDAVDLDGDGKIQKEEYAKMLSIIRINDQAVVCEAFQKIDTDADGIISHEEFVQAALEYFTTNVENVPSTFMFGPLI